MVSIITRKRAKQLVKNLPKNIKKDFIKSIRKGTLCTN